MLFRRRTSAPSLPELRLPVASSQVNVAGESHHMPAIERLVKAHGVDLRSEVEFDIDDILLRLVPEPSNRRDPNAVMVADGDGRCLGYIPRTSAPKYCPIITELSRDHQVWCSAQVGGGGVYEDGWRIGVWLQISLGDLRRFIAEQRAAPPTARTPPAPVR